MDTEQHWQKLYIAAALERDWSKMEDRIRAVEIEIAGRLRDLSQNHGGTPTELHAIADTRQKLEILRVDVARRKESKTRTSLVA